MIAPLFKMELFPFSRFPMFANAFDRYSLVFLYDNQAQLIPSDSLSLGSDYRGVPSHGLGQPEAETINHFGSLIDHQVVLDHLKSKDSAHEVETIILRHYLPSLDGKFIEESKEFLYE